MVATIRRNA